MKPLLTHAAAVLLAAGLTAGGMALRTPAPVAEPQGATTPTWQVHYSPNGGATAALVAEISTAKSTIQVLAYSFTSVPIADALIAAHGRVVLVEVIVDKSQPTAKGEQAQRCVEAGISVWVDHKHAIAHNKVLIIDGIIVATGSMNLTDPGEHANAENSVILYDKALAQKYAENFLLHKSHSEAWKVAP